VSKRYSIIPPRMKKRRSRYVIYKKIDTSYYGDNDDENGIMEKVERPMEEEMQARALREW
jgi:pre-mRNA-splicing factor ISY1